jgi:nicotinamide riboside transporter PnuC
MSAMPIDLVVSAMIIAGQWCVVQRRAMGWWLFLAANMVLILIACETQRWGLIPGYLILSAINVYGLSTWHGPMQSHARMVAPASPIKESL